MSELGGKRALVTGASSGIGAAIARELAALGADLVLTARRKDALDAVAAECANRGVRVDVITADLGKPEAATALWRAATAGGSIDICINNAGFGAFRPFSDTDWSRDAEMVQLNITSLVQLSKLFVAARSGNPGRAYVLNVASNGAYQAVPNMALYASSKAFVRNFTEALHDELAAARSPISATVVCPGGTVTGFHAAAGAGNYSWIANASMMTAEKCARIAVQAMRRGKRNVITGWINKLSCWAVRLAPRWFASWMAGRVLGKPRAGDLPTRSAA